MATKLEFGFRTTGIGSMPNPDAKEALLLINKYLSIPCWPQLPQRSKLENMYLQFSEGFPGISINDSKISINRSGKFDEQLEAFYEHYADNSYDAYQISPEYAAGLHSLLSNSTFSPEIVKGQVTGPISWGLSVTDAEGRGILYDDLLAETAAKFLHLKASWQENRLKSITPHTIIFIDEPYLSSLGSAFVAISNKQVSGLLEETLAGIQGIKGVHCCGSTDWSLLLKSSIDVLSFDAYNYADSLSTYTAEVNSFISRGGAIAWGIVPNDEEFLAKESVTSLADRIGEAIAPYTRNGISFKQIVKQSIITPSCGLASLSLDSTIRALELLSELSKHFRSRYL